MATGDSKNKGETRKWKDESEEEGAKKRKPEDPDEEYYKFQHKQRGLCLIFNQKNFEDEDLSTRHGTDKDRDDLKRVFDWLGFDVKHFDDSTEDDIMNEIDNAVEENHTDRDCVAVVIMTHGGDNDLLCAYDGQFSADDIINKFRGDSCRSLAGKPKFFFFQACRGGEVDTGVEIPATDFDDMSCKIPTTSDFLICWATYKGQKSWRYEDEGTFFIQSLVAVLEQHAFNDDLLSLMTKVNRYLIKNYPVNDEDEMKQTATIVSTLQKKVQFNEPQS